MLVQVVGNPIYQRWANLMGEDEWLDPEKYGTDELRGLNAKDISARMALWTKSRTTKEVIAILDEMRIPCGEVLTPQQALDNEQVQAMEFLVPTKYPGLSDPAPIARMPMNFSTIDNSIRTRAPTLGEHTSRILSSLGYTEEEIEELRTNRVV